MNASSDVRNSVFGLSLYRRIPNGWVDPRNLLFSPASRKAIVQKGSHSEGRNVEMRKLTPFRPRTLATRFFPLPNPLALCI